jgi:hypothetical protein
MKNILAGGAYSATSLIANAQRCINLYVEQNRQDAPFPTTHYPMPGLQAIGTTPNGGVVRCIYRDTHQNVWVVSGSDVYLTTYNYVGGLSFTLVGSLNTIRGPVSMQDNGTTIVICDGTYDGFTIDISSQTFAPLYDPAFYGSQLIDIIDGYMLFTWPGNGELYITGENAITFDATDFTAKTGFPDELQIAVCVQHYIWMLGTDTTEIWYNAGGTTFPFQRVPGVFIQHGLAANYGVAHNDNYLFWIGSDPQGRAVAYTGNNFQATRVSTSAVENEWQGYATVSDAQTYCFQLRGHVFFVTTFPSADTTWVYDLTTNEWMEWLWMDAAGDLHRHRSNCYCEAFGLHLVGDWQNGTIYILNPDVYTDGGEPIFHLRSFPHVIEGEDNARMTFNRFVAAMEVGQGFQNGTGEAPILNMRWSDDGGNSWSTARQQPLGAEGQYKTNAQFWRCGIGRDRVWELAWSASTRTALNGAFNEYKRVRN